MRNRIVAAILAGLVLSGGALRALGSAGGVFPLHVNDVSELDAPWPMIGGLPFPEGALADPAQIRIVDGAGIEVPAQIDVTDTWRDGSIRWALAGITASAQGAYRVEFGSGISRRAPDMPLKVSDAGGRLTVDTGAAIYEFRPDRLLPETARMGETVFLANAGDGAYLIDNHGRLARVAGAAAQIETRILKQGPVRTVIRREGWYVTEDGSPIARARVWFYLAAGSPALRITHSLVLTEDTNELWVHDYGLAFNTPDTPDEAVFALTEATEADRFHASRPPEENPAMIADMFSTGLAEREQTLFKVVPEGDEIYMLQENYPHVLEREFRAVIARAGSKRLAATGAVTSDNFWVHPWLKETEVAGDWAEARYAGHALTLVVPQLAQRFPKEIAVGPAGPRVALWSGRCGRDMDFRAVKLVNEYWKSWADNAIHPFGLSNRDRGPATGTRIAEQPSNAQGVARTHDVWLLPRMGAMTDAQLKAQALAAAHPPLLQADPQWMGRSAAIGWPFHPKDTARFPAVEDVISDHWTETLGGRYGHVELRRAGFIMWGKNVTLGTGPRWFRLSRGAGHYGLDRSAWLLYARSGERRYYDYGRHFTRFAGDMKLHHWTAGNRFRGGFASANVHLPFYWGDSSKLGGTFWTFGWLMEYYLTGDEYAAELLDMVADAYREHADPEQSLAGNTHSHVYNLSVLYRHTQDEHIKALAGNLAHRLIDLDNPVGLNDSLRYGVYYKTSTEWLFPLYIYYNATGDETAREVILRALDDKYRFFYSSNQTVRLFLFAQAYRWTGNPAYLGLINVMVEQPFMSLMGHHFLSGAPAALHLLANTEQPIDPFPVLAMTRDENSVVRSDFTGVGMLDHEFVEAETLPPVRVRKPANTPVNLGVFVQVSAALDEGTAPEINLTLDGKSVDNARMVKTQRFQTRNAGRWHPHRWYVDLLLPAPLAAGDYRIGFPNADTVVLLESDAPEVALDGN